MNDAQAWLQSINNQFKNAFEEAKRNMAERFADLRDGMYTAVVESIEIKESQNGKRMAMWNMVVADGEHEGKKFRKVSMLENQDQRVWFCEDLVRCGVDQVGDPVDAVGSVRDILLSIEAKTVGEHQRIYIKKRLGDRLPF